MKTILVYTGVFTAFHRKSMSHNHSCRYNNEHDVVVYTVIKDSGMHKARAPSPSLPLWGPMVKKCPCSLVFLPRVGVFDMTVFDRGQ